MGSQEPLPKINPVTGRIVFGSDGKPVMVPVGPMQMVEDDVTAYRLISRRAALGHGLEIWAKVQKDTHEIMHETKAEEARGQERSHQTSAARFILPDGTDLVPPTPVEAGDEGPAGSVTTKDGQTYEDPE